MPTKDQFRRVHRGRRDAIGPGEREALSEAIRARTLAMPEIGGASTVGVYASAGSEVQTYTLIEDLLRLGKNVVLPRITDARAGRMEMVRVRSLRDLVPGDWGLLAPRGTEAWPRPPQVLLVPGLAFSPVTGTRLGMGGGFYDRYLEAHGVGVVAALAYEVQLADTLPAAAHDRAVDLIVTEGAVHRVGGGDAG